MDKIFVVLNPKSGRGSGGRSVEAIRHTMNAARVPFDLFQTTRPREAIEVAREAKRAGYNIVAAAGGDGTINEVVNGLAQAAAPGEPVGPLAILPVGTGNDFATMVGTPPRLGEAVDAIVRSKTAASISATPRCAPRPASCRATSTTTWGWASKRR
ncbi:MAG: acylglycerol kinase family protein [Caldilineaceae bacterium]